MRNLTKVLLSALVLVSPTLTSCNSGESSSLNSSSQISQSEPIGENIMKVLVNNQTTIEVTLVDNSATRELKNKVINEYNNSLKISLHDYGSMEKVGSLGFSLPTSNKQISVDTFDVVLYQGNQICFYYDTNSWSFTRLGKITSITDINEYRNLLGTGNVEVVLSF